MVKQSCSCAIIRLDLVKTDGRHIPGLMRLRDCKQHWRIEGAKLKGQFVDKAYGCRENVAVALDGRGVVFGQ